MKLGRAVTIGAVGGALVILIVWLGGIPGRASADLCSLAAGVLFGTTTVTAWVGGLVVQLVVAIIAAIAYAALFEWATERAGVWLGIAIAIPHVIFAGLLVGFLPGERLISAGVMPPGAFYEFRGFWCISAFVLAHLVFGGLMGAAYGDARHEYRRTHRRWADTPAATGVPGA